ncbi:DUF503 domain-containing protein [Dethiobacter alkaliphilus]|uniref:DUF503 domain-containing protein n=1 Tax=Dethiobacter alkaliphilus TaxID=427926 RepID=UPI002226AECD|nr:DUF503 domain-containing protein [Dethiobacter alkaliphilus]MCW3490842.1 DUF503 domain-containing protein [Dethiobacter alkaliphilus]
MAIGILTVTLRLPGIHSLKEKRAVLKSLIARLRQKFNISVAEVGDQDKWQSAVLGIAGISGSSALMHRSLEQVLNYIEQNPDVLITNSDMEIL